MLKGVTEPLLDLVYTIVKRPLPISGRLETGRAPPSERRRGTCPSEASFGEHSFFGDDEDDPLLDFAH